MSFCSVIASASQFIVRYNKQLSTKSLTFDEVFFVISLMKIRKRRGPNTAPWGTPDVTSDLEECSLPALLLVSDLLGNP
jgi:hypothetical protein